MNLTWHPSFVTRAEREALLGQRTLTFWLTGLPAAGKSTLAHALEAHLVRHGRAAYVLDGDNVRHGLNRDLGFDEASRHENIRRVAHVCRLMNDAGLIVITAFISPLIADRALARDIIGAERFREIHVSTPLEICETRDPKGLYARARCGEVAQFTGVSAPYEAPVAPDLMLDTTRMSVEQAVQTMLRLIE